MRALRWYGREDLRLEDGTEPSADSGQVVIEVLWCGICGTDLHEYLTGPIFVPPSLIRSAASPPRSRSGTSSPAGSVELGDGVKWLKVGDRATVDAALKCGHCRYCLSGQYIRCESRGSCDWRPTGHGRYVSVQECTVHVLPDSITDDQGALLEPLSVAVHAVRRSGMAAGDSASIVGAGPIGLVTLAAARAASAGVIFIVERATAARTRPARATPTT